MADEELLQKVQGLGDLDLAALLCLMSREHCIISTEPESLDDLVDELQLVAAQTFNLKSAVVNCTAQTTLDDFAAGILLPQSPTASANSRSSSPVLTRGHPGESYFNNKLRPSHANHNNNNNHNHNNGALRALTPLSSTPYSHHHHQSGGGGSYTHHSPQIANLVLARDLDRAPKAVQIQALELLRTRRIFTRTSVQAAPKQFLFVAVLGADSAGQARVTEHLNDFLYIAHWHDPEDGFARLEERDEQYGAGAGGLRRRDTNDDDSVIDLDGDRYHSSSESLSGESVVRRRSLRGSMSSAQYFAASSSAYEPPLPKAPTSAPTKSATATTRMQPQPIHTDFTASPPSPFPSFTESEIAALSTASRQVHIDIEVLRYQMNMVSHLRMHRAVGGGRGSGVTPFATQHFGQLMQSLAALHGLDYVTPALVVLAAKKIYLHRVRIVAPAKERSMQWGSDGAAVEQLLEGVGPEDVVEDVIGMVAAAL
ncbi:hypothetical protein PG999_012068 [Apiospora kogelbergensis]|uniref:magnesium chelatase n=1 Tax=Apiospora kogelbergensis TaxID=1337665 RepID=A0AAW0QHH5_9PEZI